MATASTPASISSPAIRSTCASSSGRSTVPSALIRSSISRQRDRDSKGWIGGALMLYIAMRLPRPTIRTSLWPAVVNTARDAPSRSSAVFVATVVPWTNFSSRGTSIPSSRTPLRIPSDWLRGVDGVLRIFRLPEPRSNKTRSVNVPPTSTPSQAIFDVPQRPTNAGLRFSMNALAPSL
jgi:hypothetical protein